MNHEGMAEENLAVVIDWMTCPECGGIGSPTVVPVQDGTLWVVPRFQCDTPGCSNQRGVGDTVWTLVSNG